MRQEAAVILDLSSPTDKDNVDPWKNAEKRMWEQHRMYARQLLESYDVAPLFLRNSFSTPFGCSYNLQPNSSNDPNPVTYKCVNSGSSVEQVDLPRSVLRPDLEDGKMNYAAISEAGMLLVTGISAAKMCANDLETTCSNNTLLNMAIHEFRALDEELKSRNGVYEYVKYAIKMWTEILLGVKDLAEFIRPFGLDCYANKECKPMKTAETYDKIRLRVINGPLRRATEIQQNFMIQSPSTPTLLFMPSYEIFGHVLFFLDYHAKAKDMFEMSLKERMGRTLSIVGLARSHAMLGDSSKADYFYTYLRNQMPEAHETNKILKEATSWITSGGNINSVVDQLRWPYL